MPNPTASAQHVNSLLSNFSVGYLNSETSFAAPRVFPYVDVQKQTDLYAVYDRGDFLRDGMKRRGPYDLAAQGGYNVGTATYSIDVWAEAKLVSDREVANADDPFRPHEDAAVWLTQQRLIRQEREFVSRFFTTGLWTGSATGTDLTAGDTGYSAAWSSAASTPIEDVDVQNDAIESRTGLRGNVLVMGRPAWSKLRNHPDVIDRVRGGSSNASPAMITRQQVAALMELDEIVVASAVYNSAQEGEAANVGWIMGNHALLVHRSPNPGLFTPSGGYIFRWTGLPGQAGGGQTISTYREDDRKSDRHEIEAAFSCEVVAPLAGAFFQNVA